MIHRLTGEAQVSAEVHRSSECALNPSALLSLPARSPPAAVIGPHISASREGKTFKGRFQGKEPMLSSRGRLRALSGQWGG